MKAITVAPGVRNSIAIMDVPEPHVGNHDVLVNIARVGVCGTDQEIREGLYGKAPSGSDYLIIGHESIGEVVQVGSQVKDFVAGDHVVASVRRPCPHDRCLPCRGNQNDMCVTGDYTERGINGRHGYMAQYYGEKEQWLTKVPPDIEAVGVLLEPMSVLEKAVRQTFKIQERLPWKIENAMVLGAGAIGLLSTMLLRLEGINTYVLDRSETGAFKAQLITRLGAYHFNTMETPVAEVAAQMGRVDLVLEATGFAPLVFDAYQHLNPNGLLCLLGVSGGSRNISVDANQFNNSMVLGNRLVFGSVNANLIDFHSGVNHLEQIGQRWPGALEKLITRKTSYQEFASAFQRQPGDIKVAIEMDN